MFTLKQKISLLKKANVDVPENATEEEVDKLMDENTVEEDDEETTKDDEKSLKEITLGGLKSIVKVAMQDSEKAIEERLSKKITNVKISDEKEVNVKESADFVKKVCNGTMEKKAIDGTVGSFGYSVPTTLANMIQEKLDKEAVMRKYAFVFKMAGNYQLPQEGTAVTSHWVGQNIPVTESNPTLGKQNLVDNYLATNVIIPRGLLNSSNINILNFITNLSVRSINNAEETAFIAGSGTGEPTGLRSAAITAIPATAGATTYGDILALKYGLKRQYRKNAIFLTSTAGVLDVMSILDENKRPIFDPTQETLLNKPLLETEDIPSNLGTGGDETEIYFGDMSYYYIKDGEDLFMEQDKIIANLQIQIVIAKAVDGIYTLAEACKKLTGVTK